MEFVGRLLLRSFDIDFDFCSDDLVKQCEIVY